MSSILSTEVFRGRLLEFEMSAKLHSMGLDELGPENGRLEISCRKRGATM